MVWFGGYAWTLGMYAAAGLIAPILAQDRTETSRCILAQSEKVSLILGNVAPRAVGVRVRGTQGISLTK